MGLIDGLIGGIAKGVGSGIGKTIGKIVDWIPSPRQNKRKQVRRIKDEIKLLQSKPITTSTRARVEFLTHKLSEYDKELQEE